MLVPWTPLSPSRRELRLRRIAQALAFATALVLLGSAHQDGSMQPMAALAGLLAAAAGLVAGRCGRPEPLEIGVDDAGVVAARRAGAAELPEHPLMCVFAAPWLITLRRGTMWVRIWPDSVPGNVFRRFWVHIRWNPGRQPADLPAATARVPPG